MDKTSWLMYACAAVWIVLGLYLFCLSRRQRELEKRVQNLELTRQG